MILLRCKIFTDTMVLVAHGNNPDIILDIIGMRTKCVISVYVITFNQLHRQ